VSARAIAVDRLAPRLVGVRPMKRGPPRHHQIARRSSQPGRPVADQAGQPHSEPGGPRYCPKADGQVPDFELLTTETQSLSASSLPAYRARIRN
jgi:hypothetical protein